MHKPKYKNTLWSMGHFLNCDILSSLCSQLTYIETQQDLCVRYHQGHLISYVYVVK